MSPDERRDALCLHRALDHAEKMLGKGERSIEVLRKAMLAVLEPVPVARLDYLEFVDNETLNPVDWVIQPVLVALAVRVGKTRLIDNTILNPE